MAKVRGPGFGGSGGGGGLHFRNPVDVFASNAARNDGVFRRRLGGWRAYAVRPGPIPRDCHRDIGTSPTAFQTYTGDDGAYDDTLWLDRADAIQGFPGNDGAVGAQARFSVFGYINVSTVRPRPRLPAGQLHP